MNETEEMRRARHALHALAASDPAAHANMLHHVAALSIMVAGRRGREWRGAEPQFGAGFVLTHGVQHLCAAAARRSGTDYLYLAFDVDDAAGPPVATGVFSRRSDDIVVYGNCRLWSLADDGRALLVPQGRDGYIGYLALRPGRPFRFVGSPLPGDFEDGAHRAEARLKRLLASDALRSTKGGHLHVVRNEGERIYAQSRPLTV